MPLAACTARTHLPLIPHSSGPALPRSARACCCNAAPGYAWAEKPAWCALSHPCPLFRQNLCDWRHGGRATPFEDHPSGRLVTAAGGAPRKGENTCVRPTALLGDIAVRRAKTNQNHGLSCLWDLSTGGLGGWRFARLPATLRTTCSYRAHTVPTFYALPST